MLVILDTGPCAFLQSTVGHLSSHLWRRTPFRKGILHNVQTDCWCSQWGMCSLVTRLHAKNSFFIYLGWLGLGFGLFVCVCVCVFYCKWQTKLGRGLENEACDNPHMHTSADTITFLTISGTWSITMATVSMVAAACWNWWCRSWLRRISSVLATCCETREALPVCMCVCVLGRREEMCTLCC